MAALEEVVGDEYPLLVKAASLCGEGLYLWLWFEGERPRYRRIQPPEELFPTMLAALSCAFPSRLLGKAWGEGPERLLAFRRMSITLGDRMAIYHIATEPKEWRGGRIYLDIETGSGFALPEEYVT